MESSIFPPDGGGRFCADEKSPDAVPKDCKREKGDAIAPLAEEENLAEAVAEKINAEAKSQESEKEGGDKPIVSCKRGFRHACYLFVKRTFDVATSFSVLLAFSWLYLILVCAVFLSDGGKPVYRQKRVGKNGKTIYLPKFRSMVKDSDNLEKYLTPEQIKQYRTEYKVDNDPRITKLGNFLRKTSLDELPNIWAIFTGKISVVGPRPLVQKEIDEKYGKDGKKLLSVKPGLIGWWAVNGRSNTTYLSGERQALELYYVDHCSLALDAKIFFMAIGKVFKRDGAR